MRTFRYTARDRAGVSAAGTIQASDEFELRRILRANDLYLTQFKVASKASTEEGGLLKLKLIEPKVNLRDLVIAIRQLGTMVRAGLPLMEALVIIESQTTKEKLQVAMADIRQGVSDGQFLSHGMKRHPKLFSRLIVSLVEAGEQAGTLDQTLEIAADHLDREESLAQRVKAALVYPKLVVVACIGTIAAMLLIVVPVFSRVYGSLHAKLPAPTLLLMALSDVVCRFWWMVGLLGIAGSIGFRRYAATEKGRRNVDRLLLNIPVLGIVLRKIAIARFVQTLAGAIRGGVPVLGALAISASTAGNIVIGEAVEAAAENVRDGATISHELEKTNEFPLLVTRMISAGEATGNIDSMLEEINRFYEQDIEYAVDKLTRMIEPLMTALIGGIVLLVLLALYMPIFSLSSAFTGKK